MTSLRGRLLIAAPDLADPNFARSVILIVAHGESGAMGLILDRELDSDVSDLWRRISTRPCARREPLHHGGPVPGTLTAVHDRRSLADVVVAEDLYIALELATMEALAGSTEGRVLFYTGHSGWGPGQLETELAEGSWLLAPARAEHVFGGRHHSLWKEAATLAGRCEIHALIDPRHIPDDPRSN